MHAPRHALSPTAFTLIELLIVVAIIAILAAIAIPNFLEAQTRSKVARVKADMRSVATALEMYCVDQNVYPPEGYPDGQPGVGTVDDGILQQIDPIWDASLSLVRLTTPLAYLGSLAAVHDVFLDHIRPEDTSITGNREIHAFFYADYRSFALLRFSASEDRQFFFKGWGLSSVGPDHNTDGILFAPWQMARYGESADRSVLMRVYDPTNGTISPGDIARFGGEIPGRTVTLVSN